MIPPTKPYILSEPIEVKFIYIHGMRKKSYITVTELLDWAQFLPLYPSQGGWLRKTWCSELEISQ